MTLILQPDVGKQPCLVQGTNLELTDLFYAKPIFTFIQHESAWGIWTCIHKQETCT